MPPKKASTVTLTPEQIELCVTIMTTNKPNINDWKVVGEAMGITASAAQQRYGRMMKAITANTTTTTAAANGNSDEETANGIKTPPKTPRKRSVAETDGEGIEKLKAKRGRPKKSKKGADVKSEEADVAAEMGVKQEVDQDDGVDANAKTELEKEEEQDDGVRGGAEEVADSAVEDKAAKVEDEAGNGEE